MNWVRAIREIGNVITISEYATDIAGKSVVEPVVTVPAPVDAVDQAGAGIPGESRVNQWLRPPLRFFRGGGIDSWGM